MLFGIFFQNLTQFPSKEKWLLINYQPLNYTNYHNNFFLNYNLSSLEKKKENQGEKKKKKKRRRRKKDNNNITSFL